jgi:hypothetical protein
MIRHIFFGTVRDDVPEASIEELILNWRRMPAEIPSIRAFTAGRNVSPVDRRFTVALVADFDDWEAWNAFREHPFHDRIRHAITFKIIEPQDRSMIQIEI